MTAMKPKHTRPMNTSIRKVDLDKSDNEILELDSDSEEDSLEEVIQSKVK